MTKEEIAELIDKMPQDMDVNDFIHELVNRALSVERKWVGLTKRDLEGYSPELKTVLEYIEAILKRKNT
jgi:hypothetical protein